VKSLKLRSSAIWGMLVAGIVYAVLSLVPLMRPTPMVPVIKKSMAAGRYVGKGDINWVPLGSSQTKDWHPGYLRIGLRQGQMVLSGLLTVHQTQVKGVLVAIPVSTAVAHVGQEIHVLVISSSGHLWASSPVTVVSAPSPSGLTGSGGVPLVVAMPWNEAVTFEKLSIHGTVSVVGIRS
jgi:hypothetical protein